MAAVPYYPVILWLSLGQQSAEQVSVYCCSLSDEGGLEIPVLLHRNTASVAQHRNPFCLLLPRERHSETRTHRWGGSGKEGGGGGGGGGEGGEGHNH